MKEKRISSVLLVTDPGLRKGGSTATLEALLAEQGVSCAVYDQTNANPTVKNVEAARAVYLEHRCQGLIAFGGGSSRDCAKAVGARIAYPNKTLGQLKGLLKVLRKIPLLIAIPTTAGTGSETTVTAVITDREQKHKYTMNNFTLIPRYAVLDPAVTHSLCPYSWTPENWSNSTTMQPIGGTNMQIEELVQRQRAYFQSGATLPVSFRMEQLRTLYNAVQKYEPDLCRALTEDLGKSDFEGFMCEAGLVLTEIRYMIRHVKGFAREKTVPTPLAQFASRSYKKPSPYGNTLIMSPWNYPVLLALDPLADAIAAGNTAIVKPSAYSPATSAVLAKLIAECFPPEYVAVVTGGRKENAALLDQKFDFVFFTGSQNVGREVLRHTAETLTPAVLELGGKSPCIVDSTAKLDLAARRIVFGKYLNCGQTCVAPDYILCQQRVLEPFVQALCKEIRRQFGENPLQNPDYGRIVNEKHFDRLLGLLDEKKAVHGGRADRTALQIEPTVLTNVTWDDPVMQEEIFGPILPILTFDNFEEIYTLLAGKPKPLALYIFSEDRQRIREVTERCAYGGGCVNDVVIHLATSEMGFGGVGESGMGSYHGKQGFEAFSHTKSILDKKT